ncbi:MAG: acetoin utilization protein AcuC [Magnetovibrio sp.]|nr:acetoin utilization protein AcuC [Magnetovibrio sp.]
MDGKKPVPGGSVRRAGPRFIASEIYRSTTYGSSHPLGIPRVSLVTDLCRALGWLDDANFIDSPKAGKSELSKFHTDAYIEAVFAADRDREAAPETARRHHIGVNGNPIFSGMFHRPATACGGGLFAARRLAAGAGVFHSPGGGQHHGRPDRASGFCYFNEPVLSIMEMLDLGLERVFYLDLDAHHGDGVQDAFTDDERVRTLSIHEAGRWPMRRDGKATDPGGAADRAGGGARNLPVPEGFNDSELEFLMETVVLPSIDAFDPAAVYIQAGSDALADDPQSKLRLSNGALWRAVAQVAPMTERLLVAGGGGYNPYAVGRCWAGVWAALNGYDIPDRLPDGAEALLREIVWQHRRGREPFDHWMTTLEDRANPGPVRDAVRDVAKEVLRS